MDLPEKTPSSDDWRTPSQSVRQTLAAAFSRSLESHAQEELRRGITVVGPHRDDFLISASGTDLARYGSRGQQRLAVVAIKMAELDLLRDAAGESPVLLLDDVLSELDVEHRSMIITSIAARQAQVCVTATDETDLESSELAHLALIRISGGAVGQGDANWPNEYRFALRPEGHLVSPLGADDDELEFSLFVHVEAAPGY
jgi:DNA replication and repair protein RecF